MPGHHDHRRPHSGITQTSQYLQAIHRAEPVIQQDEIDAFSFDALQRGFRFSLEMSRLHIAAIEMADGTKIHLIVDHQQHPQSLFRIVAVLFMLSSSQEARLLGVFEFTQQ